MDRLIAVSRSIEAKLEREGRVGAPCSSSTTASTLTATTHQEACCTLPEEYGFAPGTPIVGVVARLEAEKGHTTLLEAWPLVLEQVPTARLLVVGEGSLRERLEAAGRIVGPAG